MFKRVVFIVVSLLVAVFSRVPAADAENAIGPRIYVNGEPALLMEGAYESMTFAPMRESSNNKVYIGMFSGGGMLFRGIMDEVRIYNRALSPEEVAARYAGKEVAEEALVAWLRFDETAGDIAADSAPVPDDDRGYLHNFDHVSGVSGWTKDAVAGGALQFDGVDDWVEIPQSPSLDISKGITVELWLKPTVEDQHGKLVVFGDPFKLILAIDEWHRVYPELFLADGTFWTCRTLPYLPAQKWTHVVLTYQGASS